MKSFLLCLVFAITTCLAYTQEHCDTLEELPKLTLLNHKKVMKKLLGAPKEQVKTYGILVYDGFDPMETIAPMVVLSELSNIQIDYIGIDKKGKTKGENFSIEVNKTISEVKQLDFLFIPGAKAELMPKLLENKQLIQWIKNIDSKSIFTTASGNGVYLLAQTQGTANRTMACHPYKASENLKKWNIQYSPKRYFKDGKYLTSQPSTAVIDLMLFYIYELYGKNYTQAAMLDLEYDPFPPFGKNDLTPPNGNEIICNNGLALQQENNTDFTRKKKAGIVLYNGFFTLDALGPIYAFGKTKSIELIIMAPDSGWIKTGRTKIFVEKNYSQVDALDILLLPGGSLSTWNMANDTALRSWILKIDKQTEFTTSVCTGAWILGKAGLLHQKQATTHWYRKDEMLTRLGAIPVKKRYTNDGKYWTSAGVSAGIDFSIALIEKIAGKEEALKISSLMHYTPEPIIPGGVPEKSDPRVTDMMQQMYDYMMLKKLNSDKP
jgi:transcriptional regulator GlxA family with amidase domain